MDVIVIQELINNMATFEEMSQRKQEKANQIGVGEFLYLDDKGDWIRPRSDHFTDRDRYRLCSDYVDSNSTSKGIQVKDGPLIVITTCNGKIGFDASQEYLTSEDAIKVAREILEQAYMA